jgi:hypothetical protein
MAGAGIDYSFVLWIGLWVVLGVAAGVWVVVWLTKDMR